MNCPFLREARVRFCQTAAFRKMIPDSPHAPAAERCSSGEFAHCPVYVRQAHHPASGGHCPLLRESLMQYCGAAAVPKMVPYSESLLSRCGSGAFRYCDLYLEMANPETGAAKEAVDGIRVPDHLYYTPNHMWVDVSEGGLCHIGVDAFVTRLAGSIDQIGFATARGRLRPTAVLTVRGVDLQMTFPRPLLLANTNVYLRANPARLADRPYTQGWLFEGAEIDSGGELIPGAEAHDWMQDEVRRMSEFLQTSVRGAGQYLADGGVFSPGVVAHLSREETLALFHEFFSPYASRKRS